MQLTGTAHHAHIATQQKTEFPRNQHQHQQKKQKRRTPIEYQMSHSTLRRRKMESWKMAQLQTTITSV